MSSHKRMTTFQKATALVPLALLSGAWTTSLTMTGTASAAGQDGKLPDGTSVPDQAIKAPASVSGPGEIAPGVPKGSGDQVIAGASANGIPAAALAAYQRAAQVIDSADKGCNIDWTLIAAIGRVESNHGRYGGNTLDGNGVSRPGIYGIPLDGSNGTSKIADTDAGQYDNDPQYDRAVGPMQFIPSTWSVVGVDGDSDGKRDPQDIDDAALATAVYLCSGNEDLSTTDGQKSAVYRYNHSQEYVDLVLSIMRAYADGDFSSVPTSSAGTTTFTPDYGDSVLASGTTGYHYPKARSGHRAGARGGGSAASGSTPRSGTGGSTGTTGTTGGAPPVGDPTGGTKSDPGGTVNDTVKKATGGATTATKPVVDTIGSIAEATSFCSSQLAGITGDATVISKCAERVNGQTKTDAAAMIPNTLSGVLSWLGLPSLPGSGGGGILP
jgi:transglycosylase-like protein with SLT domain